MSFSVRVTTLCLAFFLAASAFAQTAERFIVLEGTTASAHIFDTASNTELGSIRVGATPGAVVVAPNGRLAFVSNLNSEYVSVIDLTINAEVKRIHNVSAFYMAMTSDGSLIVATDPRNEQVFVIDANAQTLSNLISLNGFLGDNPNANDLGLDNLAVVGHKAYINTSDSIGVINLDTSSVAAVSTPLPAAVFSNAENIAVTADGSYVVAVRQGGLVVISTADDSFIQTLGVTGFSLAATGPSSDPARNYVYLLRNAGGPTFSILDMTTGSATFGQIIANAPLPGNVPLNTQTRVASSRDGSRAYITCQTRTNPNVLVIDTSAAISNPVAAVIAQSQVGVQARASFAALVQTQASTTAPVVAGVDTPLVSNDVAHTITVQGSGFAPGAFVRIGTLDPLSAQFISAAALQITIPQSAPAEAPAIVVTNPDQQSGILRGGFVVATPPAFQPVNQVGFSDFAESTFGVLNVGTNVALSLFFPTAATPQGIAITPDGTRAYIETFFPPAGVDVFNFTTGTMETHITINGDPRSAPGQTQGIVLAPLFGTNHLVAYVVSGRSLPPAPPFTEQLYAIDADPASATFNQVIEEIPTGAPNPSTAHGSLAVTPDGHYAFINEFENVTPVLDGNLIVLDLSSSTSSVIPDSTLGISAFQPSMELSSDSKFLVLGDDAGELLIMDVGTNPLSPVLVKRLTGTPPAGFQPLSLITPRIVGQRLFAFDPIQNVVDFFNFNPSVPDFSELGTFAFSATSNDFGIAGDLTADGKLMYLPLREEDSIAVISVDKALANDPTALITKIGVGIAPTVSRVRPGTPVPGASSPTDVVTVAPAPGVSVSLTGPSAGTVSVATTNTTPFSAPAGFQIGSIPTYYEISSTSSFSDAVVCFTYNPAQVPSPESSLRLSHYNSAIDPSTGQVTGWEDVTLDGYPNTATHTICGQVSSFSPFVIGIASADFLFQSLLAEISALPGGETPPGIMRSLRASVLAARSAHQRGQNNAAVNQLQAFISKLQAMSGISISSSDAASFSAEAQALIADLQ